MPVPQDYITKAYSALKDNLSGFDKTPDQFKSLITNDPTYRGKVYSALKDNIEGFDKTPQTFDSLIVDSQKKNSNLSIGADGQLQSSNPVTSDSEAQSFAPGGVDVKAAAEQNKEENPNASELDSFNPIDLAKQSDELSKQTLSANDPLSVSGTGTVETPNTQSINKSKEIDDYLTINGYDPKQIKQLFTDFPDDYYDKLGITKDRLAQEIKTNPVKAQQVISSAKWQIPLQEEAIKQGANVTDIQDMRNAFASDQTDYLTKRRLAPQLLQTIRQFAPDNKTMEQWQSNFANDAAQAYGDVKDNDPTLIKEQQQYPDLNINQVRALDYLKDVAPDKAQGYAAALIDPKKIKDNYDAQVGQQEKLKRLDEIGISLKENTLKDKISNNPNDADTESQLQDLQNQRSDVLLKYPKAGVNDAELFAQELLGQKHTGLNWLALETGKATSNAANSIWDLVSEPFRSEENSKVRQLSTLGDMQTAEGETNLTQENQTSQSFIPTIKKGSELESFVNNLKDNKDLSESEKSKMLTERLMRNPDQWQRTPIEGGKSNLGITSLLYGTGQLAANLAPYVLAETVTGGGASAGFARKFTASFASALGTGFHEAYQQAINDGDSDPYTTALRRTAISSAAMAGAQTPQAIRDMLAGTKSAASDIVSKMADDEILGALRKEPKTMSAFSKSIDFAKNTATNVGEGLFRGVKGAAKILPITTAGQVVNDVIDDNVKSPQDYLKQAAIEGLKFTILGGIGGTLGKIGKEPNEMNKAALFTAGEKPEAFLEALKQKEDNGTISPNDAKQVKDNIEKAQAVFKKVPFVDSHGKALSEKSRRDLLFLKMQENDLEDHMSSDLPESLIATMEKRLSDTQDKIDKLYKGTLIDENTQAKKTEIPISTKKTSIADEGINKVEQPTKETKINEPINKEENAIQELSTSSLLQHTQEGIGETWSGRGGMESSKQGEEIAGESGGIPKVQEEKNNATSNEENTVGIRHESLKKIADKLGLKQPERGTFLTPEEQTQRGRQLLAGGADPEKIATEFKEDGKVNADIISVVRAHNENLTKGAQKAMDTFGKSSKEFRDAKDKLQTWQDEVAKPMGTTSGGAFSALQGENDLDTGSFIATQIALEDRTGKPITPQQEKKIIDLTNTVKDLTSKNKILEKRLADALDKNIGEENKKGTFAETTKKVADAFRKLKTKPFIFKDKDGNEYNVQSQGVTWNEAVEFGAKVIEKTGKIADGIAEVIDKIKDADWYKKVSDTDKKEFANQLEQHYQSESDIHTRFIDKKDNKFSTQDAKDIWEYAKKNYIDKDYSYGDMLRGVSKELGLTGNQVREALSQPKSVREITDEMYRTQQKRLDAINAAKQYVQTANQSKLVKFARALPNAFFRLKVFGHGTVGGITHAGMNIFQPSKWKLYFPFFLRQFKYSFGSTAEYAKAMEDLKNDPDFTFWKRSGLAIDPSEVYDDYQSGAGKLKPSSNLLVKFLQRLKVAGDRGFNALKVYRLSLAKSFYDGLSNVEKADPNTAKEIAQLVNHSTGTTDVKVPSVANTLFFAPKLEISRWQSLITDPAKALGTFTNWSNATDAQKVQAKIVARNAGEKMATYMAALAANSAILSLTGSNQNINYSDPTKSDWLKFKGEDKTLDVSGGTESTMRFIGSLVNEAVIAYTGTKQELKGDKPQDKDYKSIMTQMRYKMSPFASTITDLVTGTDAMGKPLPFSNVKPRKGEEGYTVGSYLLQQQAPIPVAEGVKEIVTSMKEKGMTTPQVIDLLKGLGSFVVAGGTGAKLGEEPKGGGTGGGGGASSEFKQPKQPSQPKQPKQ